MVEQSIHHLLMFQVGQWRFGIRMPFVKQVQTAEDQWNENRPRGDVAEIRFENRTIAVYRIHRLLNALPPNGDNQGQKVMILDHPDQAFGLLADKVDGVVGVDPGRIEPLPHVAGGAALASFPEIFNDEDGPVLVIHPVGLEAQCRQLSNVDATDPLTEPEAQPEPTDDGTAHAGQPLPVSAGIDTDPAVLQYCQDLLDAGYLEKTLCTAIETIAQQKMNRIFALAFGLTHGHLLQTEETEGLN